MEPQKPFACSILNCGMAFTNEDHLHVHTKKHDMVLQLGAEQKAAFVADQTPTPTRFIRNCEEVGLFQELQIVNPFEEGFKRAMETKAGILCLDGAVSASTEELHTPQMMFLNLTDGDSTLYTTTNNQRNITISRSSSDESGAVKEYETTTISKLRNEVTTISRIIEKHDVLDKITGNDDTSKKNANNTTNKDTVNEIVSYTDNIIQIHSNTAITSDNNVEHMKNNQLYTDSVIKDNVINKDVMLTESNKLQVPDCIPPIMSQKSIDFVVDSLTSDPSCQADIIDVEKDKEEPHIKRNIENKVTRTCDKLAKRGVIKLNDVIKANNESKIATPDSTADYEVIIKLPNKKYIRMKAVEEIMSEKVKPQVQDKTKEELRKALINKASKIAKKEQPEMQSINIDNAQIVPNILPMGGTLYPVTIVNPVTPILLTNSLQKIPIRAENKIKTEPKHEQYYKKTAKRKAKATKVDIGDTQTSINKNNKDCVIENKSTEDRARSKTTRVYEDKSTFAKHCLESRSAASRRYRERLKRTMASQREESADLRMTNSRLAAENVRLKEWILQHATRCNHDDYHSLQDLLDTAKKH